jgi:hypothetical protein
MATIFYKSGDVLPYRITDIDISRSVSDDMWSLTATIDKNSCPTPMTQICVVNNGIPIFLGIIPSYDQTYDLADNRMTIQAYSNEWYLAHQFLDWKMLQTSQLTINPGATGEYTDYPNPTNFIDALFYQTITFNTTTKLFSGSGSSLPITKAFSENAGSWVLPAAAISGDVVIKKQWIWDTKTTKLDVIRQIADYAKMVFFTRITGTSPTFLTKYYWVNQANVDSANFSTGALYVPVQYDVSLANNVVVNPIRRKVDHSLNYNYITVAGVDKVNGAWYYYNTPATPPASALEYRFQTSEINSGSTVALDPTYPTLKTKGNLIVKARGDALLSYFTTPTITYTIIIKGKTELEPYQKVKFVDFNTVSDIAANSIMRITRVSRHIGDYDTVTIECTDDVQWLKHRELARLFGSDFARQQQATKDKYFVNLTKIATGNVISIDVASGTCIVKLERGDYAEWGENLVRARLLNQ